MWTTNINLDPRREIESSSLPFQRVIPGRNVFEASQAGDVQRVEYLLTTGINVNARDRWDSSALYYACLTGHLDLIQLLLENGAIFYTRFGRDRCHYVALNLQVRQFFKSFKAKAPPVKNSPPPPLQPLQAALRKIFMGCKANQQLEQTIDNSINLAGAGRSSEPLKLTKSSISTGSTFCSHFPPDVVLFVCDRPIEAHRIILSARSPLFKMKFEMMAACEEESKLEELCLDGLRIFNYSAVYSLISFFYSDRLEVAFDDIEDLVQISQVFVCKGLHQVLEKELLPALPNYMVMRHLDKYSSKTLLILDGEYLPEEERLPAALHQILQVSLARSMWEESLGVDHHTVVAAVPSTDVCDIQIYKELDFADVYVRVGKRTFRCHQLILASRSEYFRTRLSRMKGFLEGKDDDDDQFVVLGGHTSTATLPLLQINDLSSEAFAKITEYMYTDSLKDVDPAQAEEMFDAASRYLMLPLKHVVADALMPHLELASTVELYDHWLAVSKLYGVTKITKYCQDRISCTIKEFVRSQEFREMFPCSSTLPVPVPVPSTGSSSSLRTSTLPPCGVNDEFGEMFSISGSTLPPIPSARSSLYTCTLPAAGAQDIDGDQGENCISFLEMIFLQCRRCILGPWR